MEVVYAAQKRFRVDWPGGGRVEEHKSLYGNAARMVLSPRLKAFDITQEKDAVRDRYGRTAFACSGRKAVPAACQSQNS